MRWLFRFTLVGATYGAGVLLWTLLPHERLVPDPVWVAVFAGGLLAGLPYAIQLNVIRYRTRILPPPKGLVSRAHEVLLWSVGALAVLVGAVAAVNTQDMNHRKIFIRDGHHVLIDSHGVVTPISDKQYLTWQVAGQRMFAGLGMAAFVVVAWQLLATARSMTDRFERAQQLQQTRAARPPQEAVGD